MKKLPFFLASLLIGVVLFFWVGRIVGWQQIKNALLIFTGWQGLVIFGLTFLFVVVGNWKWREILKDEGVKISFSDLFRPYLMGSALTFLVPNILWGGEIFRSYVIKGENQIPWSKGMASVITDRILEWTTNLAVIFFGMLFFLYKISLPPKNLGIVFGVVFLFFLIGICYFYFKTFKKESLAKALGKIFNRSLDSEPLEIEKEIFDYFGIKSKAMWKGFGLSLLRALIEYIRIWLLIIFLGKEISFLPVFSILGFSYLAVMIPIPTALGSHEALQTFAFNSLKLGASTATAFTMIIRGAELLVALVGIIILFRSGISSLKNTWFKERVEDN